MKTIRKLSILLVIMVLNLYFSLTVMAATAEQDGLEVSYTTDKESYQENEEITVTLTVKNTGTNAISNVQLQPETPDNYSIKEGMDASKTIESLDPDGSESLSVTYNRKETSIVPGSDSNGSNSNSKPSKTNGTTTKPTSGNTTTRTTTGSGAKTGSGVRTGDTNNIALWAAVFVAAAVVAGIAIIVFKKKKTGKKLLSTLLVGAIGLSLLMSNASDVRADSASTANKEISISETVNVGDATMELSATVKYETINEQNPTDPDDDTDPDDNTDPVPGTPDDEYYNENSDVIKVIKADTSEDVPTEAEVIQLLSDRGFSDFPVEFYYDINGNFVDEGVASEDSSERRPMYITYYVAESGSVWSIFVINGQVIANPASYNLESGLDMQTLVSESEQLTSYLYDSNKFYITIPNDTEVIVKTVDKINAETLDRLTDEEISRL